MISMSTPSVSNQLRTRVAPISALFLVIAVDDVDVETLGLRIEVDDGLAGAFHAGHAEHVGVDAGEVGEHGDLDAGHGGAGRLDGGG